ncbi:hypothetical protein [Paenibacillus agri]|uniref:Uncharacterized protein n=1 Tax=Paenibacillus agri TaxID=2744309 RepID=A0A850EJA5_9BACL|nr:hypothetical protein [Paenibacillus agri]NUU60456.1 hypothetical protein [Paenibacillus agri]
MARNKELAWSELQLAGEDTLKSLHLLQIKSSNHVPLLKESAFRIQPVTERLLQYIHVIQGDSDSVSKLSAAEPRTAHKPTLFFRK